MRGVCSNVNIVVLRHLQHTAYKDTNVPNAIIQAQQIKMWECTQNQGTLEKFTHALSCLQEQHWGLFQIDKVCHQHRKRIQAAQWPCSLCTLSTIPGLGEPWFAFYCQNFCPRDGQWRERRGWQLNNLVKLFVKTLKSEGIQGLNMGFIIFAVGIFMYYGV